MFVLLAVTLGLAGCMPRPPLLYVPDPHPTPLLTGAGDAQVTVGGVIVPLEGDNLVEALGNGVLVEGYVQAAVSPVDHVGVFGLASYVSEPEHTHGYAEAGAVVYGRLGETLRAELLAGGGWGDVEGEGTFSTFSTSFEAYTATAALERLFVQGNAWWQAGQRQWGFSLRTARVRFTGVRSSRGGGRDLGDVQAWYSEPGFFFRETHGPIRVGMHAVLSFPHGEPRDADYRHRPFAVGLDLGLDLGRLLGTRND
jgi:hypothetical protein